MQTERGTTTNSEGYFLISDLPVGIYDLKFQHVAKQDLIIKDVRVHLGKTASLGEIKQSDKILDTPDIIVYGEKPLIDLTTTTIGENLNVKDFDPLPIDRDFSAILALLPQANTSYYGDNINIAGNSGYENFYFIDGIDATDPFSGAGSINLPYNFIREIQVMEGGYEAEY